MIKNLYFLFSILFIIHSCNSYKIAEKKMEKGDFASAFETSLKVFKKNSSLKKKEKQLILLQASYLQANEEDIRKLDYNRKINDYKQVYLTTKNLYNRNNSIKPFLPLSHNGKELKFPVKDYSSELTTAKEDYLNQYYTIALDLLSTKNKNKARQAYSYLTEVKSVDQYYRDVSNKQQEAYLQGADIILVSYENLTGVPFPPDFKNNLLDLTSSISNFWTKITTNPAAPRDYEMNIILRQAFIGRDIVTTNTFNYEKDIIDGWEYLKDRRGNIVKDSLGNASRVDRYIKARARVVEYVRHKEAMLSADIQLYNVYTQSIIGNYPEAVNFAFESAFATVDGDRRALDNDILRIVDTSPQSFPNNYDMISQCGIRLKARIIDILNSFN